MTMQKIATENFASWIEALETKDPKKVAAMYTEDATFLPTLSSEFKRGPSGAEEYFIHFLQKNPDGKIVKEAVQEFGDDLYLHSGLYDFEVDQELESDRTVAKARFTYVWKKNADGNWKILHHHSSIKPA